MERGPLDRADFGRNRSEMDKAVYSAGVRVSAK
jgi:hypothetical protein